VIPEEKCSRVHAEIVEVEGEWVLRDLQSRNGTLLNGLAIEQGTVLSGGDLIQIASGQMEFVESLAGVFEPPSESAKGGLGGSTGQTESIIARRDQSGILGDGPFGHLGSTGSSLPIDGAIFRALFQLAFDLSSVHTAEEASEAALKLLIAQSGADCGGVFLLATGRELEITEANRESKQPDLILLATQQQGGKGYRRPSDFLVKTIAVEAEG